MTLVSLSLQMLLLSQDYGKHLLGVEDLLQKHALVEADIGIQADRVRNVNSNAQKFADDMEGETDGQKTCSVSVWLLVVVRSDRNKRA